MTPKCVGPGVVATLVLASFTMGDARSSDTPTYRRDIAPLLLARCVKCHGPLTPKADLSFCTPRSLARGGESGPPVIPGSAETSLLWQRVDLDEMPPDEPLADDQKQLLRNWIDNGAAGLPSWEESTSGEPDHWAFRRIVVLTPPKLEHDDRARNDVDRYLLAAIDRVGLSYNEDADPATIVRRASFALTGLPPTPEETALYATDSDEDAYERMVDRFLTSPHYGERWAQHWLDAAGYADSNGYFSADTDRPLAYRYRDYVIRAVGTDKPIDRFMQEQIAGDELAGYVPGGDITPEMVDPLVATHFLRNAPDGTDSSDGNPMERRLDRFSVIEGTVQILASTTLGLTVQCSRCHDHKFEPVRQREYYALQAILYSAYDPDRWLPPSKRIVEVGTCAEREEYARRRKALDVRIEQIRTGLAEFAKPLRAQLVEERLAALDDSVREQLLAAQARPQDTRTPEDNRLLFTYRNTLKPSEKALAERFEGYAAARKTTDAEIGSLNRSLSPVDRLSILTDLPGPPSPHHVLVRGDYLDLGDEVDPGVPAALCASGCRFTVEDSNGGIQGTGRRLAYARWVTSPANPVFARLTVNRIWQHLFGRGLVATTDNFGHTGSEPSHPELLDYLSNSLIEHGWSRKQLIRLIVCSTAFRQSSKLTSEKRAADPDNSLLSRFPLQRLDAEAVRDSMLAVSGELNTTPFGPYVPTKRLKDGEVVVAANDANALRRSIYLQHRRTQLPTMFAVFDAPSMVTNCPQRSNATIPLQALNLLNSDFVNARAAAVARRVMRLAEGLNARGIDLAFLLVLGRSPTTAERQASESFLSDQPRTYASRENAEQLAWQDFCQMLLASNAFLYVE